MWQTNGNHKHNQVHHHWVPMGLQPFSMSLSLSVNHSHRWKHIEIEGWILETEKLYKFAVIGIGMITESTSKPCILAAVAQARIT